MRHIEYQIPQSDLFHRDHPAIEGMQGEPWAVGRTVIDFGCALLASSSQLRGDRRIRDAVLTALLRRALITTEGIWNLLAAGLEEPALGLGRTLLDIELNIKLVHQDETDAMAKRLAAFHYYAYQRHGEDMLRDRGTREGSLARFERVDEVVRVTRSYAQLLESSVFDDVRDGVRRSQYWHGLRNTEEAFRQIDQLSDFVMSYDGANWFVHAINVDFDYDPSDNGDVFHLKALPQRHPRIIRTYLAHAIFRLFAILSVYVEERGLPSSKEFGALSTMTDPDGSSMDLSAMEALALLLTSAFGPAVRPPGDGVGE